MRAPRALIPLLAVCGAAAVVAVAGAGAAIEGLPDVGPAHADGARKKVAAATVTTMTWNVCGDAEPGCPLGSKPAELVKRIPAQIDANEVGGRRVKANAVLLQEVCAGHVTALKHAASLRAWSWTFAPSGKSRTCANGEGRPGVAIGTKAALTGVKIVPLPAPSRQERVAVCGDVESWSTRLCSTQFSSSSWDDDPSGDWRRKQVHRLTTALEGARRVIVGGDLADRPDGTTLDPLYRAYAECDQGPGTARAGAGTAQNWRGEATEKTDYLFTTKAAGISCGVPAVATHASDHRPVTAVIRFRPPSAPSSR
ncbi:MULTISPECIES: endonuclease/exonuclease/phosphatase family protein [Thermomonosporaceae]|uniref:endonuclease/exonuclease/phosphatase family protein n=1 Tax=Thermomonosporaceae TaxID=2012 RepID=UPI00255A8D96|nr:MULTISPECIES: endonuclease/exonuclease/phosphatase family protein [Thermomonosporaceae]MDL4773579.1 endonuclease/exonuclease/phosphatase family protein [Actinomadura xylanilytica]